MIDQSRTSYFTPYDDAQTPFINLLKAARKKIRLADYSFNLAPVAQALVDQHKAGIDVSVVLDKSQSKGASEIPEVKMLQDAGVPLVIGGSAKGKIMHLKCTIVDDCVVASGSYNYTGTAELEDNFEDIETNPTRAQAFTDYWTKVHDFIESKGG